MSTQSEGEIVILLLKNPDPIFYGSLNQVLSVALRQQGAKVVEVSLKSLSFTMDSHGISFYNEKEPLEFDAFLSYGYMSPKHYQDYLYLNAACEAAEKVTLHVPQTEEVLSNKLLQAMKFSKFGIPIPKTFTAFSVKGIKNTVFSNFEKEEPAVLKEVTGYGGDGVSLSSCAEETVNKVSKMLWNNQQTVIQKFVSDSLGRSIRVVVVGGQAVAVTEFIDQSDEFKSNGYREDFRQISLMDSERRVKYSQLGVQAVQAIDKDMIIGGVDILDSEKDGLVVLEVNGWPEIIEANEVTKVNLIQKFCAKFIERIKLQ